MNFFEFDVRTELDSLFIFRENLRRSSILPEYRDLYCEQCTKVDELAALERGISHHLKVRGGIDFAYTGDDMVIVSQVAREVLEAAAPSELRFFPFSDGGYSVIWPINVIAVPPDAPLYRKKHPPKFVVALRSPRCSACGRPGSVTVRPHVGNYSDAQKIVALRAEGQAANFAYVMHCSIGEALDAARSRGWKRIPLNAGST